MMELHLAGLFSDTSIMSTWGTEEDKNLCGLSIRNKKRDLHVRGSLTEEISVHVLDSGYMLVFINTPFVRTVMLVDEYGWGSHACYASGGYTTPYEYEENLTVSIAVRLNDLALEEDVLVELMSTINEEYLSMLNNRGYTSGGFEEREDEIKYIVSNDDVKWSV